jgi:anaerobic ribonucleoside-triphosphate reductase
MAVTAWQGVLFLGNEILQKIAQNMGEGRKNEIFFLHPQPTKQLRKDFNRERRRIYYPKTNLEGKKHEMA